MQYNSYAMQFLYDEIKAEERCNKLQYSTGCNEAPKVQMPRWNATISHTQQQTAAVIPCCTAITMQYNSC